jgi:hypothetical protein
VGVKDGIATVAEIVAIGEATGEAAGCVSDGVGIVGSAVITSTLNVQPEINMAIAISQTVNFLMMLSFWWTLHIGSESQYHEYARDSN